MVGLRARPREHFRSDSISSSGTYRSPSMVNVGVPKSNFDSYKFNKDRTAYLEKEKRLEEEAINLAKKKYKDEGRKLYATSAVLPVAGGVLGGGVGLYAGIGASAGNIVKKQKILKEEEADINKLEKKFKEYREKGE